jgi:hypothetical protein
MGSVADYVLVGSTVPNAPGYAGQGVDGQGRNFRAFQAG